MYSNQKNNKIKQHTSFTEDKKKTDIVIPYFYNKKTIINEIKAT